MAASKGFGGSGAGGASGSGDSIAHSERLELCDLLEELGPLAPTLCEGWATSDLAAHLFVRESRPWAGIGILLPAFAGFTQRTMDGAKRSLGYDGLLRHIRSGPPLVMKPLDSRVNAVEYFIHHEDVRRAGTGTAAAPRDYPALDEALWTNLKRAGRILTRKVKGTGLALVAPGHGTFTARAGSPVVTMTGSPQELMLYLFGRKSAAHVELAGPDQAKRIVEEASLGL
ncbi:MAG: TIGR03085 family metal-binding protein [Acidimicrobiales bacterium]